MPNKTQQDQEFKIGEPGMENPGGIKAAASGDDPVAEPTCAPGFHWDANRQMCVPDDPS